MPQEIWEKAIDYAGDCTEVVSLGGGEPLLHPDFEKILFKCLGHENIDYTWLATNGLETERAKIIAGMSKRIESFSCELSVDSYHESPDNEVYHMFEQLGAIRNNDEHLKNNGSC